MVVIDPMRNLSKFFGEKIESADNHLDAFDDYLKIQHINVAEANVAQIITRFDYSLSGKAKSGSTKVELVDHMPLLQTGML